MDRITRAFVLLCACVWVRSENLVFDDGPGLGRRFDGIGGLSGGGATSKLLVNYPEKLRDQILDYLFKPNFGASLQILKVEIGGDIQSTDGTEASHMHNKWEENYNRGYEWWLMKEAKKRNSKIKLYGLPWGFPGWIGEGTNNAYANNTQTADYVVRWINGAKDVHGLTIDYVGLHNEGSWNVNYTIILRSLLDARGFSNVQIVAADGFGWSWSPAGDINADPQGAFAKAVFAVGAHYTGSYSSPDAKACGRPLWSSEDWSTFNDGVGGGCWARLLNQNYVNGLMTSTIAWNLIASYYENLPYDRTGLMTALEPWSGHYVVSTPIWVSAHTCQFTSPGWFYLKHGSGVGRLASGGSYVAFIAPESNPWGRQDVTIVLETMSHDHSICKRPHLPDYDVKPQTVTLELRGAFSNLKMMYVWKSKIGFDGAPDEMFIQQPNATIVNNTITLSLGVDEIWTVTTWAKGNKGSYPDPPASKPFVLPYSDDMEAYDLYMEPYNLAQQMGSFEVLQDASTETEAANKYARQMSLMRPVHWCGADSADRALNVIGTNWTEGFVEVDFRLPSVNATKGAFVAMRVDKGGCNGAAAWGVYFFAFSNKFIVTNDLAQNHTLSTGAIQFKTEEWHKLSLLVQNNIATGAFDGKTVFNVTLPSQTPKAGFAAIGTDSYGLADFDNLKLDTKAAGLKVMDGYTRKSNDGEPKNIIYPRFRHIQS